MRYEGTRKSKRDPEVDVYAFALGYAEIELLADLSKHYNKSIPFSLQTQQVKQRLSGIERGLRDAMTYRKLEKRNLGNPQEDAPVQ